VDESATGSVNFLTDNHLGCASMHLRMPSIDQGVHAFVWAFVFFLFLWLGALALKFPGGTSFIISLLAAGAIFLLVRVRGGDYPGPR